MDTDAHTITDAEIDSIKERIKHRKVGSDAVLDYLGARKLTVTPTIVTKVETFTSRRTADSGNEGVVAKFFTERDCYLITVKNWDAVEDKETYFRMEIVPMLSDQFKLDPKVPVVFQFLDGSGKPMRHVPTPGPHVMASGD